MIAWLHSLNLGMLNQGDNVKFEDPAMKNYFLSLPQGVRRYLEDSGVELSTLGELMMIGEHFKENPPPAEQGTIKGTSR
ncbi:MAG TPA: hypothetical protein VN421_04960 [Pseudoflavonifractor sp.]|nr:hypothetical protein [Pseudoflavonifractor sp.]